MPAYGARHRLQRAKHGTIGRVARAKLETVIEVFIDTQPLCYATAGVLWGFCECIERHNYQPLITHRLPPRAEVLYIRTVLDVAGQDIRTSSVVDIRPCGRLHLAASSSTYWKNESDGSMRAKLFRVYWNDDQTHWTGSRSTTTMRGWPSIWARSSRAVSW